MDSYYIPAAEISVSEEIKKSRFITYLAPANGVEAAKNYIQHLRQQHPTARHHCWAFVAGAPYDSQQFGFSDDGEPSGTAGKPILAQLMGSGLGEVVAVVVRYYGGIKLGTGGLVKAYGSGVQQALIQLSTLEKTPQLFYRLRCDYAQLTTVEMLFKQTACTIQHIEYGTEIVLTVGVPHKHIDEIASRLSNFSRGSLALEPLQAR